MTPSRPRSAHGDHVIELASRRRRGFPSAVPLIAREREMAELRDALEAALDGSGRVVLLGGEPGIGKTRLATALAGEAEARSVPVCWGRGWEDGSAPAFWPWNTALRRWIDQVGTDAVTAAAGPWAAELAHVFPVLRDCIPDLPPGERWDSDGARFRLFDLVSEFLRAVARPAGLVVVLDDVHWADRSSLRLLEFLAADLADAPLLIVATYRDTEVEREHPFFATLSRLARETTFRRLVLSGLSPAHCARWIALAGLRGDAAALGEVLHRETNGNPFFVGEVVHLMAGEDAPGIAVPHGVREVISRRLDRLGDDCRRTLAVAALCGDTIEARLLSQVLDGLPTADYLVRSVRDRILVEAEGRYAFAHALIRRVLVDELAPSMQAAWHGRIATVLERQASVATTELVRHLAAAGTPEALGKAFDYACRGAEEAALGLGWEEAVRLYEIALDVGKRSGLLDSARRNALRLALARALRGTGDVPAARRVCDEVLATSRGGRDPETFARAALVYAGAMPEWGKVEPPVRAVLEEACRQGEELGDELRARLCARLAGDIVAASEVDQGARVFALCDEAAEAARRANAPGALAIALLASYLAFGMRMRPAGAHVPIPNPQEMLEAGEAGGEHEIVAAIRYARAMTMLGYGELDGFSAEVDGLVTAAASSRVPEALWLADALVALRANVQGRFDDAWEAMDRALATGRRAQLPNAAGVHATQRIMCFAFQGRLGEVVSEIDAFVESDSAGAGWRPLRAVAKLASGDAVAARAEFEDLIAGGFGSADRGVMSRAYLMGLALLCVSLGDRERAPRIYERVARRKETWSIDGCIALGPWSLALGALARLCGRPEEAVRHYEEAIRVGRRMGARPIVARGLSLLASLRLSLGVFGDEQAVVGEMLDEAGQGAEELGLADVAARVARLRAKLVAKVEPEAAFRNEGDVWVVRYAGLELRLRDGKGPRYLATLLAAPGREVHVLAFGAGVAAEVSSRVGDELEVGGLGGSLDGAPDERAREEYRARVGELRAELDEAELFADAGRAERVRAELEDLTVQLAGRFGGRVALSGPAETARKAVTKVLRTQIGKLLEVHPALGRHLRESVRMGTTCVYAPPTTVEWDVAFGAA